LTDLFDHEERVVPCLAVSKLREKYLSLNTYHLVERRRNSIEFRILEGTKDSHLASSWIGFVLNFVRQSAARPIPENYRWVELSDFESLIASDFYMDWILGRIAENWGGDSSHFWRSVADAEGVVFGRMPSFIDRLRDK
jgi:hypothetical protein